MIINRDVWTWAWTWDQGHNREHHFCFLPRFTTVDWEGWSTSHFDLRQTWWFQFPHHKLSVLPSSPAYGVFISQLIRYSRACSSYECFILRARRLSSKLLKQGYLAERLKSSFRKFYGRYGDLSQQYEVSLSRMLNDILLDQQWLPNQSDFPPISWPWYRAWPSPIMSGFHGAFATGVACQQGTLTTPDTWFRPLFGGLHVLWLLRPVSPTLHRFNDLPKLTFTEFRGFHGAFVTGVACQQGALTLPDTWFRPPFWDLLMLQLLRPNSSNLPSLYSAFNLEYPLVLSRFCIVHKFICVGVLKWDTRTFMLKWNASEASRKKL